LRIAELIQFGDYGAWGEGVIASRTLRDAIRFAARNICAIETGTAVALREHGPNAYLSVEFLGPVRHSPLHHAEAHLFVARKILDLASEHVPAMAHLPQEHRHRGDLEPWFGERLEYGSDRVELVFDRDALPLLLQPPLFTDPDGPEGTARGIMGRIEELMEFERPTAQAVAVALNINVRTMQRHLSAWGLTFEELLDQHRQRIAQQYLQSGELSITDIAFRLGYSDSPHFNRAFRRWTGLSPRQAQTRIAS
jgi:AraC-like DNA-binding protein